jgi:hypothetical protein
MKVLLPQNVHRIIELDNEEQVEGIKKDKR